MYNHKYTLRYLYDSKTHKPEYTGELFMTYENLLTFGMGDSLEDIEEIMKTNRFHNFPVIDSDGKYVGLISRRRLLNMRRKKVILVDHNEASQAVDGIEKADVLEIIDHHRLGGFETLGPVYFRNQPGGMHSHDNPSDVR